MHSRGPATLAGVIPRELVDDSSRIAVIEAARETSFAALDHDADQMALAMLALSLRAGDRIALWMEPCAEWLAVAIGVARAGCVLVTVDSSASAAEIEQALAESSAKVLVVSTRPMRGLRLGPLKEAVPQCFRGEPGATRTPALPDLRAVIACGPEVPDGTFAVSAALGLGRAVSRDRLLSRIVKTTPDDPAWLAYVPAIDGRTRGVVLSHASLCERIGALTTLLGEARGPVLQALPLTDVTAALAGGFGSLWRGAPQVFADGAEAGDALAWIPRIGAREVVGEPSFARALFRHPDRARWGAPDLRVMVLGALRPSGQPVLGARIVGDGGFEALELLGTPEAAGPFAVVSSTVEPGGAESRRAHPIGGFEIRAVQGDEPLGVGQMGELEVRGPGLMLAYCADSIATERCLRSGWFRLPLVGTIDATGCAELRPDPQDSSTVPPPLGSVALPA